MIKNYSEFDFLSFDHDSIMAFLNYSENNNYKLKINHLMYETIMEIICGYVNGTTSRPELNALFRHYEQLKFPVLPLKLRNLYKTAIEVENTYTDILFKRLKRENKHLKRTLSALEI